MRAQPFNFVLLSLVCLVLATFNTANAYECAEKKVLYVNSYHKGYAGSDPITDGVRSVLDEHGVEHTTIYMDTKRNPSPAFIPSKP